MKASALKNVLKAGLAAAVCGVALVAAPASVADVNMPTNGGMTCEGSSGFGAHAFYFSNTYAENTLTNAQYLTCELPTANANVATTPVTIYWFMHNTTGASINFTCAMQAGYNGSDGVVNTSIYQTAVGANGLEIGAATNATNPALPVANNAYAPYSMSCLVPPGGRIGLITVTLPGNVL